MFHSVAALAYGLLIGTLFYWNRDSTERVSGALWIPVVWLSICASRAVSQWLGEVGSDANEFVEGNALDAFIFFCLLVAGLVALRTRAPTVKALLRANSLLLIFFAYCALSVVWSDYPIVAFKRWVKAVGDLVMILLVLTDSQPTAALKRLLARVGFVLVPVSVLLIKHYPSLGRAYSPWNGEAFNIGVATHKSSLGYVCLIFGLGALWCLLEAHQGKDRARGPGPLLAQGALLALVLWLFRMADSATSLTCFLIGGALMTATKWFTAARKPIVVHLLVGTILSVVAYGLLINPDAGLVEKVGRDPTLTGRTALWGQLLGTNTSPWFGVGYESFWLGERLERIWDNEKSQQRVNQAHNGYLEIFLNLGWVGVVLLGLVAVQGYGATARMLRLDSALGRIKLACFVVAAIYNLTEHAFRELHPVWIGFLLAVVVIPEPRNQSPSGKVTRPQG